MPEIDILIAVLVLLASMAFGWWLQRREARVLGELVVRTSKESEERVTRILQDHSRILEGIAKTLDGLKEILGRMSSKRSTKS